VPAQKIGRGGVRGSQAAAHEVQRQRRTVNLADAGSREGELVFDVV
jgi:hypothetical protein